MKRNTVDPGFLSVFRLFVVIWLLLSLLPMVAVRLSPESARIHIVPRPFFSVIAGLLLLGYLSWGWLRDRMGNYYLPVALGIVTVVPLIENFVTSFPQRPDEIGFFRAFAGQWQVAIMLLIPLILISWLYSFRVVVLYCFGLAIAEVIQMATMWGGLIPNLMPGLGVTVSRTFFYLLVGYIIVRLVSELRDQNKQLVEANQKLASYTNTLEQLTISRERNRLAREFHDTLAHTLSAVAVQLEAVNSLWSPDPPKAHELLENSLGITRNGLNETRRAIQALRAAPLDDLGLSLAVSNLARTTVEKMGIALELRMMNNISPLTPEVEHSIYRIAEEGLRNVTQHAGASKVVVSLEQTDGHIQLTIQDDGRGFDTAHIQGEDHFGLQFLRERAESIGGELQIHSQPGQGTCISLKVKV